MGVLDLFRLEGKKALVTGSGRGIGKCIALGLAEAGADVSSVDIDSESARRTAQEIGGLGARSIAIEADVTRPEQVEGMVAAHADEFGRFDILVNNAGMAIHAAAEEMTIEQWDAVMNLNLRAMFMVCQAVGREMIERKQGSIVNIASISGSIANVPQPQSAYNTSKAGVILLTKSLASEWAPHGIRVNCISPGYTMTEMVMMPAIRKMHPTWSGLTPMGRLAKPEEIKGAAVFLASEAASYVTGHDLVVDGGYTAR